MYAISDDNLPVVAAHVALSVRVVLNISISLLKLDMSARTDYNKIKLHSLNSPHRGQGLSSSLMHLHA